MWNDRDRKLDTMQEQRLRGNPPVYSSITEKQSHGGAFLSLIFCENEFLAASASIREMRVSPDLRLRHPRTGAAATIGAVDRDAVRAKP